MKEPTPLQGGYGLFRQGSVVKRHVTRSLRVVHLDPMLLGLIRYHASDAGEEDDLIEFCDHPVRLEQLAIVVRLLKRPRPLLIDEISVDQRDDAITAHMQKGLASDSIEWSWRSNTVVHFGATVPETIAQRLVGRPLGDLMTHPYMPTDLVITDFHKGENGFSAVFI